MSSPDKNSPQQLAPPKNYKTILFIITVCGTCALILAVLASALHEKQLQAKKLDQSKQLLIATRILSYKNYFLLPENGTYVPAAYDESKEILFPSTPPKKASQKDILEIFSHRVIPLLVDNEGNTTTFSAAKIDFAKYVEENEKKGYANLPLKLIYSVLPNLPFSQLNETTSPIGYVIPVNGMGLWDAIYGYLAVENNGDTVIGTTWYEQAETAGLGAVISLPSWQEQFHDKVIFQQTAEGTTNFARAPIGIVVVKGKVSDIYGNSPKAKSAVDGITGATLTGMGVTNAYRNVLQKYRPFLLKIHEEK